MRCRRGTHIFKTGSASGTGTIIPSGTAGVVRIDPGRLTVKSSDPSLAYHVFRLSSRPTGILGLELLIAFTHMHNDMNNVTSVQEFPMICTDNVSCDMRM
eukprot:COSAG02_NODE_12063_length_1604_cov_8.902990_2_plen_100_part_00